MTQMSSTTHLTTVSAGGSFHLLRGFGMNLPVLFEVPWDSMISSLRWMAMAVTTK
jgi:hypothetical protein